MYSYSNTSMSGVIYSKNTEKKRNHNVPLLFTQNKKSNKRAGLYSTSTLQQDIQT
jgi:hypothetical protein